jgi:CPA1 family monovalent cation:H+ antiporter
MAPIAAGSRDDQLLLGFLALGNRERELILEHFSAQTIAGRVVDELLGDTSRIIDRTRARGPSEYLRAAQRAIQFRARFRFAHYLHRRFAIERPLEDAVANRFERLLVLRIVLDQLEPYIAEKLVPLVGTSVGADLRRALEERQEMTSAALAALRVQHADYAELVERRFLSKVALRYEDQEQQTLLRDGVIGPELYSALQRDLQSTRATVDVRPPLDLGLDARELIAQVPIFQRLSPEQVEQLARLLHPRFVIPGEVLIRQGDQGDSMYFISSGAVVVDPDDRRIRLERGAFFGELSLLSGEPRQATVEAATYGQLLVLYAKDFQRLLAGNKSLRVEIDRVAKARWEENREN